MVCPRISAQPQATGSTDYPPTAKTEGCFNDFFTLLQISYGGAGQESLNNIRCRARCAASGFSMSATSAQSCHCGNNYPSVFHRVRDTQCSQPCSPDRTVCEESGCCGDAKGKYFTVSFAREIDVTLQLLRTLTFDYRVQNKLFQQHVEGRLASAASLMVASFDGVEAMSSTASTNALVDGVIGFGNGCPTGWAVHKRACYKRVSGRLTDFSTAQTTCQNMGGNLPMLKTVDENDFVRSLLNGQAGWLGMTAKSGRWDWDLFTGWGPGEPASAGPTKLSSLFGPGGGTTFNDYSEDIVALDTLTIGYRVTGIDAIQVSYLRKDGTIYAGPSRGAFQRTSNTAAIALAQDERIAKVEGTSSGAQLRTLTFIVTNLNGGNAKTYGPYGTSLLGNSGGTSSFSYTPGDVIMAVYGSHTDMAVTQIGFVESNIPRCTSVDDAGNWKAIDCDMKQDGVTYLCERRPISTSAIDCPDGWISYGSACYQGQTGNQVSWNEARMKCVQLGGSLANVDSSTTKSQVQGLMGGKGFLGVKDLSITPGKTRQWGWQGFSAWGSNQPRANQACSLMEPSGLWASTDCGTLHSTRSVVCETEALDTICNCPSGWQAFQCSCYSVQQQLPQQTWDGAAFSCESQKARLVNVGSREETNFLLGLTKGQGMFLGLKDSERSGKLTSGYFRKWSGDRAPPVGGGADAQCATMRPDGSWASISCLSQIGTYVCQRRMTAPEASVHDVSNGERFRFLQVDTQQPVLWGQPIPVRIQHADSGAFMAVDFTGRVYQTFVESSKDTLFQLETVPSTNAFLIQSLAYEAMYLNYDPSTGGLMGGTAKLNVSDYAVETGIGGTNSVSIANAQAIKKNRLLAEKRRDGRGVKYTEKKKPDATPAPKRESRRKRTNRRDLQAGGTQGYEGTGGAGFTLAGNTPASTMAPFQKYANLPATVFMASTLIAPLALQNLQISVAVFREDTMESPRLCTMFIYDLTPNSDSYTCYQVQGDPTGLPLVEMEMAAWITQDKTSILSPRSPLENGRTRCENSAPAETVTCNVAYGEGLTFQRELDITFGQYYAFFFQINQGSAAGSGGNFGGYYNFQAAYTNVYTSQVIRSYIETRNWAVVVPVSPQSLATVQFWISTVDINYVWQAILNAQGSFDISSMGLYLSTGQSLTTLSYLEDLFFYTFGTFAYPSQAEIIITVDDVENQKYPFPVPSMTNVVRHAEVQEEKEKHVLGKGRNFPGSLELLDGKGGM